MGITKTNGEKLETMAKKKDDSSIESLLSQYSTLSDSSFQRDKVRVNPACVNTLFGGGITPGSMYGFWGGAGSGKSTIALQIVRSYCAQGRKCAIIDTEHALNDNQLQSFGLYDYLKSGLLFVFNNAGDFSDVEVLIEGIKDAGGFELVVLDSETETAVASDGLKVADVRLGLHARQSGYILQKMKTLFFRSNIASIIIFHARANIQMTGIPAHGAPATKQAGGYAATHIPDLILKVSGGQKFRQDPSDKQSAVVGRFVTLECEKNKFAIPFQQITERLFFGLGISEKYSTIDRALELGVIVRRGPYYLLPNGDQVCGLSELYKISNDVVRTLKEQLPAMELASTGMSASSMDSGDVLDSDDTGEVEDAEFADD